MTTALIARINIYKHVDIILQHQPVFTADSINSNPPGEGLELREVEPVAAEQKYIYTLGLYKNNTFIDYISTCDYISNLLISPDRQHFAFIQVNLETNMLELVYYKINESEQFIELNNTISIDYDLCDNIIPDYSFNNPDNCAYLYYAGFPLDVVSVSDSNKYLVFKVEWNRLYIIDLATNEKTEFYIPNSRANILPQVVHVCKNYILWFGYDEYVRVIDLSTPVLSMWRDKIKNNEPDYYKRTKYFIPINDYIVFMDINTNMMMVKINLQKQRFNFVYDIAYPATGYKNMSYHDGNIILTNDKYMCTLNLTYKSCKIKKITP